MTLIRKNTPDDYLRGSKNVGGKYTAWSTYNQGKPDFGKGAGPGEPYHEVKKTNRLPGPKKWPDRKSSAQWQTAVQSRIPRSGSAQSLGDARIVAIKKRLGWR